MTIETLEFRAEVKQLLDLMIHSLYSHKEIFLRELISNASDAIDKARYESLTDKDIAEDQNGWKIRISADKSAGRLMVSDNGIGMTRDEAVKALGTIAHSGTKEFFEALRNKDIKVNPELIGQFGVGFYSSFMVADRVTVLSRRAGSGSKNGVKWESRGDGLFTVEDIEKEGKGTDVILHLKDDEKKYLDELEIKSIVKKYSDFIEHPIVMDVEREKQSELDKTKKVNIREDETLNSQKALWLKDRSEISEDEYNEFYRHVSHDFAGSARVIHYRAEGTNEFTALLYIPSTKPFDIFYKEFRIGPALYVRRVQIMDHCEELIPPYLRFIKGVVDSSDLPLNVSREILQNNRQVEVIRKSLTKKVLDTLGEMKKNEFDKYLGFYREFGKVLKEGVHLDYARREQIADLLLFESTKTEEGKYRTLQAYVDDMKDGQEDIYYITGTSRSDLLRSPYIEAFKAKGYEVFLMLDEIDDFILGGLEFKGKKLKSSVKGDISLDKSEKEDREKSKDRYKKLVVFMKERLKDEVKDVRLSGRLMDSPCCLVSEEGDPDPNMERLLKAMGQDLPAVKRILEINPVNPLIEAMNKFVERDVKGAALEEYVDILYDQALLLEGSKPKDPVALTKAVSRLIVEDLEHSAK